MKTLYKIISCILIIGLGWSCTKEGLQGPEGAPGAVGPSGRDGSVIYSGTGAPALTVGANGDYFLDRASGNLYGPKTTAGWGSALSLVGGGVVPGPQGPQGPAGPQGTTGSQGPVGTPGSQIHSGNGSPSVAGATSGDYYLDNNSLLLYGPFSAGSWGTGILLRGAQGVQGPVGPAGANGSIIYSGNSAPDPALGTSGDYYFNRSAGSLYGPKTGSGWGTGVSLIGPAGATGATGAQGVSGPTGATGAAGAAGSQIIGSVGPPANTTGNNGDFYFDRGSYLFYGPKAGGAWPAGTSLKGRAGNANVMAYQTSATSNPSWYVGNRVYTGGGYTTYSYILSQQKPASTDTSTFFRLPDSVSSAANNGIILVYLRMHNPSPTDTVNRWIQLSYQDLSTTGYPYMYDYTLSSGPTGKVAVRIICATPNGGAAFPRGVDKVRIVVAPQSATGTLTALTKGSAPKLEAVMAGLHLGENSFQELR